MRVGSKVQSAGQPLNSVAGQNYVTRDETLAAIVRAADVQAGELLLEIGPGTGNLTRHLLLAGAHVTAVEKDDALFAGLQQEFGEVPNLRLVHGDVLQADVPALLESMEGQARAVGTSGGEAGGSGRRVRKVVANLPYNITRDCLHQLLPLGGTLDHLYIMLQDEVARRLTAKKPGGADYRAMNLEVAYFSRARYLFQIDKTAYFPEPGVHGAMVHFALTPPARRLSVPSEKGFLALMRRGFSSRRKMLRNTLQDLYEPQAVADALQEIGLSPDARAQELLIKDFAALQCLLEDRQQLAAADSQTRTVESSE